MCEGRNENRNCIHRHTQYVYIYILPPVSQAAVGLYDGYVAIWNVTFGVVSNDNLSTFATREIDLTSSARRSTFN